MNFNVDDDAGNMLFNVKESKCATFTAAVVSVQGLLY